MSRAELIIYLLPAIAFAVIVAGVALGAVVALFERNHD
jgi:hypothetical protein